MQMRNENILFCVVVFDFLNYFYELYGTKDKVLYFFNCYVQAKHEKITATND